MKLSSFYTFVTLPFLILSATVSSTEAAKDWSISTTFGYESEYVFRGVQFADHSFQPAVDIAYGEFYFGTWVNQPIVDPKAMFLNEVDFYGGVAFDVNDNLSLDFGLTYYWFPEEPATDTQTRELYLGVSTGSSWAPDATFYYDFDLDTFTLEIAKGWSIPLDGSPASPLTLDPAIYIGYVSPKGADDGLYYGGSVDINYSFNDYGSAGIGVRASGIDSALTSGRTSNMWWGMVFSVGF